MNLTGIRPTRSGLVGLALALFMLALAVRWPGLDTFWTTDETRWVERSYHFLVGLLEPAYSCPPVPQGRQIETQGLGCSFQTVHPGITTMWSGSVGILARYVLVEWPAGRSIRDYLVNLSVDPTDAGLIGPVRVPTVLLTSLFVALFFGLAVRLFEWRVALVAALLLALDPFHAALSRVLHHDALATTFLTLSFMSLLGYWGRRWSGWWLAFSGAMAGLAFLSKSLALVLLPAVAGLGCWLLLRRRQLRSGPTWLRLGRDWLAWGLIAGLVGLLLFPAVWVIPGEVVARLFQTTQEIVGDGHTHFFLGRIVSDPGWLFYPVGLLLRLSPLVVLGLIVFVVVGLVRVGRRSIPAPEASNLTLIGGMAGYLLLFLVVLSLADKKLVRYTLPLFPVLNILAAIGLLWLGDRLWRCLRLTSARRWSVATLSLIILLAQGWFIIDHYPYYSTYYSPLLGGPTGAARLMTIIGWGEGQDQAAAYLNQKPEAAQLRVANWGHRTFAPFFGGQTNDYSSRPGNVLQNDYLVLYISQLPRQQVEEPLRRYVERHLRPEQRITLHGLDYVLIYRLPVDQPVDWERSQLVDEAILFGYTIGADGLRLFWQNQALSPTKDWWLGLQPVDAEEVQWQRCRLNPAFQVDRAQPQAILESKCGDLFGTLPPGVYNLQVGVGASRVSMQPLDMPEGQAALRISPADRSP